MTRTLPGLFLGKKTKTKSNLISDPVLQSMTDITHAVPANTVNGTEVKGCTSDPELEGDEGCMSTSGSRVVFPPPCPCLALALELSSNITHSPSADPHIAHSGLKIRGSKIENGH